MVDIYVDLQHRLKNSQAYQWKVVKVVWNAWKARVIASQYSFDDQLVARAG
jgi:hypothetical protein